MADGMNFKWFYCEGDLPLAGNGAIDWEGFGFTRAGIAWAVANHYQVTNADGVMISLFPIENEKIFQESVGVFLESLRDQQSAAAPWQIVPENLPYKIISQEECDAIHEKLVAEAEAREAELADIPTEDDIYKAQELLLLTELCNGVAELKAAGSAKE